MCTLATREVGMGCGATSPCEACHECEASCLGVSFTWGKLSLGHSYSDVKRKQLSEEVQENRWFGHPNSLIQLDMNIFYKC